MMKKHLIVVIMLGTALSAVPSCVVDNLTESGTKVLERISTLEEQVSGINSSITRLEEVDRTLISSIDYLTSKVREDSASMRTINSQIEELRWQDSIVNVKISDLRRYTDSLVRHTEDWVNGTFATLKQYDDLCTVVAGLGTKVDSLDHAHTDALDQAVSDLETSMKDWVNQKLTDYYTIAQVDAGLTELRKADTVLNDAIESQKRSLDTVRAETAAQQRSIDSIKTELNVQKEALVTVKSEIEAQKRALDTAKTEITAAYTAAIVTAIESLRGELNQKINDDITAAKNDLQGKIDAVNSRIDGIEGRLVTAEQKISALEGRVSAIENDVSEILSRIQSISVIPDLSDGSVRAVWNDSTFTVRLSIYPLDAAQKIAENTYMQTSVEMVETATKSSSAFKQLMIKEMKYEDELLKLTVSAKSIPEECFNGAKRAFARVLFSNDRYQKASGMFPMTSIHYADSLRLSAGSCFIKRDTTFNLRYTLTPSYSPDAVIYSSTDPSVATVDEDGMVTTLREGVTFITAETSGGYSLSDTCMIGVGMLPGLFSISSTQKVYFSAGNLRARKGSASDWSDASFFICSDQLSALGDANISGTSLADEIDLFGWSGSTGSARWGISTSTTTSDYSGDFLDWAQNIGAGWKTMVREETDYLFNQRSNHSKLCKAPVTVADFTHCIVLAPDDFTGTIQSSYTESEWREAEKLGLVCIISSGYRSGAFMNLYKSRVDWWTATKYDSNRAYTISVSSGGSPCFTDYSRCDGQTVRLVYVISE